MANPPLAKCGESALKGSIVRATLLANGAALTTGTTETGTVINVPGQSLDPIATVIKLEVKGTIN